MGIKRIIVIVLLLLTAALLCKHVSDWWHRQRYLQASSQDGKTYAAIQDDGMTVKVWDADTGRQIESLRYGTPVIGIRIYHGPFGAYGPHEEYLSVRTIGSGPWIWFLPGVH